MLRHLFSSLTITKTCANWFQMRWFWPVIASVPPVTARSPWSRRDCTPTLIVLDLMMPVMNGWQFLEAQRKDPGLASVPVIVVTAGPDSHAEGGVDAVEIRTDLTGFVEELVGESYEAPWAVCFPAGRRW